MNSNIASQNKGSLISHIEINVSQYAESIRFYDLVLKSLGWKRLLCQTTHTTFTDGFSKFILCPTEEAHSEIPFHRKRAGLNHLAFHADSKEAVETFYREVLLKNNVPLLYEQKPTGDDAYFAVFFEDPDRIKLEVVYAPSYCDPKDWTN